MTAFEDRVAGTWIWIVFFQFVALKNTKGSSVLAFNLVPPHLLFSKPVWITTDISSGCSTPNASLDRIQHRVLSTTRGFHDTISFTKAHHCPSVAVSPPYTQPFFWVYFQKTENKTYLNCRNHCIHAAWERIKPWCSHQPSNQTLRHFITTTWDCGRTGSGREVAL